MNTRKRREKNRRNRLRKRVKVCRSICKTSTDYGCRWLAWHYLRAMGAE